MRPAFKRCVNTKNMAWGLGFLCLVSGALNLLLANKALNLYRVQSWLRLNPLESTGTTHFPTADSDIDVVLAGDSRVAQWPPRPLDTSGVRRLNLGVPGHTTAQCRLLLDQDSGGIKPTVFVLQVGVNDLKMIGLFPEQSEQIIEQCKSNIQAIVDTCRRRGSKVILTTVFPFGPVEWLRRPIWSDRSLEARGEVNSFLVGLQDPPQVTVVDCDVVLLQKGRLRPEYAVDALHMNPRGYEAINVVLEPILRQVLEEASLLCPN